MKRKRRNLLIQHHLPDIIKVTTFQVSFILSANAKTKNIINVKRKLIEAAIILDIKNKYFGVFTFVIIPEFDIMEDIPVFVASLK